MKKALAILSFVLAIAVCYSEQIGGDNSISLNIGHSVCDVFRMQADTYPVSFEYVRRMNQRVALCSIVSPRVGSYPDISFSFGARFYFMVEDYETDFVPRKYRSYWFDFYPLTYDVLLAEDLYRGIYPFRSCMRIGFTALFGKVYLCEGSVGMVLDESSKSLYPVIGLSIGTRFGYSESAEFRESERETAQ